jgi:hypothetical protein
MNSRNKAAIKSCELTAQSAMRDALDFYQIQMMSFVSSANALAANHLSMKQRAIDKYSQQVASMPSNLSESCLCQLKNVSLSTDIKQCMFPFD